MQALMQSHELSRMPDAETIVQTGGHAVANADTDKGAKEGAQCMWSDAVAFTRGKSPASFDQWFSGVQFDALTDGVLSLRARDEFVRQWVEEYFLPTLADRLSAQTGLSIQVRWTIDGALERPMADPGASFAPVKPRALSVRPVIQDDVGTVAAAPTTGVHPIVA